MVSSSSRHRLPQAGGTGFGLSGDILTPECWLQPLHRDVGVAPLPPRPADCDLFSLQAGHEAGGSELTALSRVEDLWPPVTVQHHLQGIQCPSSPVNEGGLSRTTTPTQTRSPQPQRGSGLEEACLLPFLLLCERGY